MLVQQRAFPWGGRRASYNCKGKLWKIKIVLKIFDLSIRGFLCNYKCDLHIECDVRSHGGRVPVHPKSALLNASSSVAHRNRSLRLCLETGSVRMQILLHKGPQAVFPCCSYQNRRFMRKVNVPFSTTAKVCHPKSDVIQLPAVQDTSQAGKRKASIKSPVESLPTKVGRLTIRVLSRCPPGIGRGNTAPHKTHCSTSYDYKKREENSGGGLKNVE